MNFRIAVAAAVLVLAHASAAWAQDFQVGARAKGMGGSYTAFEDDPTSIWMNPAGIATQSTQMSIIYQTYTQYEPDFTKAPSFVGDPEVGVIDPQLLPSFQGFVFQLGTAEAPMAVGVAYIRPVHIKMTYDFTDPGNNIIDEIEEQQFSRIRVCFAYDFQLRPAGEPGTLTHIAVGIGLDMGFTKWHERYNGDFVDTGDTLDNSDTSSRFGYGIGFLVGVYDNTDDFKVVFGLAIQSKLAFELQQDSTLFPIWDWPAMTTVGLTGYFLKGMVLRITVDLQMIDWDEATADAFGSTGRPNFRDVTNISIGGEYKYKLNPEGTLKLLPRLGFRFIEAPWEDENNLPAIGQNKLQIDTKGGEYTAVTLGAGLYWVSEDGKSRGVDLGLEFGGDADNFSLSYTHEF